MDKIVFLVVRPRFLWLGPIILLLLSACGEAVQPAIQPEVTVEVGQPFSERGAFLADEQNTIDVVNNNGPRVVAINVNVQGEAM